MSRRRFRALLLILIILSLCLLGFIILEQRPPLPHRVSDAPNITRVLFIGNSYTYVNNLPGLLIELSKGEAKPVDAEMVVEGGATLNSLWDKGTGQGTAQAAIQSARWDYIVLQEQSTLGGYEVVNGIDQIGDPSGFYDGVRKFDDAIRQVGAKTLLYMTWARRNAPQNQAFLTNAYLTIAKERHAIVAPVGLAWQAALNKLPGLPLYQDDGSHPDVLGSYLAACVFYATIYGKSPEDLPGQITNTLVDAAGEAQTGVVNLTAQEAQFLQQIAWQVVAQPS
ncbi:MAG TPA: DUF4886 domain-containing protein [Phototrophicaceae bacterium]|nr:DUF4886 domain-containing protein [Phototrophicaceae bacterium]